MKAVKQSVSKMTSHLQLISSYLEMQDYTKALSKTREGIKELHALATSLTGLADGGMTVPEDGAVAVPHSSTVVSHEDVNVDVDDDEVRSVDRKEVRAGCDHDNPKTKWRESFLAVQAAASYPRYWIVYNAIPPLASVARPTLIAFLGN